MRHDTLVYIATREAWRAWLAANHATERDVWLAYAKKHTGLPRVAYPDAVDEALCFGWIDSTTHRVDDRYYAQRFTPRRPKSEWSETNRRRFRALVKEGRVTVAGLAKGPGRRTASERAKVEVRRAAAATVPAYLKAALAKHPRARENFERLPPGQRRLYIVWIADARRDDTRRRRLAEAMGRLGRNERIGLK